MRCGMQKQCKKQAGGRVEESIRARCRNRLLRHGARPRGFLAFVQKRPRPAQQAGSFPRAPSFRLHVGPAGQEALCAAVPGPQSEAKAGSGRRAWDGANPRPGLIHLSVARARTQRTTCEVLLSSPSRRIGSCRVFSRGGTHRLPSVSLCTLQVSPRGSPSPPPIHLRLRAGRRLRPACGASSHFHPAFSLPHIVRIPPGELANVLVDVLEALFGLFQLLLQSSHRDRHLLPAAGFETRLRSRPRLLSRRGRKGVGKRREMMDSSVQPMRIGFGASGFDHSATGRGGRRPSLGV